MSKILIYTVTNNNYYHKIKMMVNSFLEYNNINIHIISTDSNIKLRDTKNKIIIHDASILYNEFFDHCKRPSYACKKLKSVINNFVNLTDYDYIIYSDADVLFYKSIDTLIKKIDQNFMYFSYDGFRHRSDRVFPICTGFFVFNPHKFSTLLIDWKIEIDKLIIQQSKFLDQPAMRTLLLNTEYYRNLCKIIDIEDISQKAKKNNVIATHYIRRRSHNMYNDYKIFFNDEYKNLIL